MKRSKINLATENDSAYRGYLIKVSPFSNGCRIEKGGFHIGYAKDLADAQRIIDELI